MPQFTSVRNRFTRDPRHPGWKDPTCRGAKRSNYERFIQAIPALLGTGMGTGTSTGTHVQFGDLWRATVSNVHVLQTPVK